MKGYWGFRIGGLIAAVILIAVTLAGVVQAAPVQRPLQAPIGTDFTYQGYLEDGGVPANGTYAMQFLLFNGPESYATQVGSTLMLNSVEVVDGYFTVELDFGATPWSNGLEMFLEIKVWDRLGMPNYTTLEPRQKIGPVPYAVYADYADSIPFGGNGVADSAARSDHTHFGQTWTSAGPIGLRISNSSISSDATALAGVASDVSATNVGVYGQSDSPNGLAGQFNNASSNGVAILGVSNGEKPTMVLNNDGVDGVVLVLENHGTNIHGSGGGDFIQAVNDGGSDVQFRVATDGEVFSDKGYNCGVDITDHVFATAFGSETAQNELTLDPCLSDNSPADFAEMLPSQGEIEVGEVLAIGPEGLLVMSSEAYQTTVVGVHSYRPSYLGNARFADEEGYVPLAMMGVVPVKASAENGAIMPGDLLVASDTPGHAMRAGENPPQGTVIGKALSALEAGTGYIQMIVTLQ